MAEATEDADEHPVLNRETLLDSVVNVIPMVIIAFFVVLFLVASPWAGLRPLIGLLAFAIMVAMFVSMGYLTWEIAKRI